MTSTINGVGTRLSAERNLTDEEIKKWSPHFPFNPHRDVHQYRIATESFVFLFIPLIPLKTFVFYYMNQGFMNSRYAIIYYPAGEGKVYWEHVKKSWQFYIAPVLITIIVIWSIISSLV